jgi:hypothetical protein
MDITTIVVSKLCCPGCWEYLDIMRGKVNRFKVRGRHPTLFPFELPAYTSPQVMREMIIRFEGFLHDEILTMMMSTDRVRAPSRQSISNSSTGSQNDERPGPRDGRAIFKATFGNPGEDPDEDEELDEDEEGEELDEDEDEELGEG